MVTYKGRPVFPFEVDWSNSPKLSLGYDVRDGQTGFGRETTEPLQQHAVHLFEQTIHCATPCEVNRLQRFLYSLQGRRYGFWLPGPLHELEIVAQVDAEEIDIVACGLTASWQEQPAKHLWMSQTDTGESAGAKIVAVVDNGNGTERVRLESPLAVSPDALWSVARLYYVRMASDSIFAAMDAPKSTGFRPERAPLMIAFLKAAVDELDCLAAD